MSYPIVIVRWSDAVVYSDGEHQPRHEPVTLTAIGWLLKYDDKGISIANEYGPLDSEWRQEHFIPDQMILSVEEVEFETPLDT